MTDLGYTVRNIFQVVITDGARPCNMLNFRDVTDDLFSHERGAIGPFPGHVLVGIVICDTVDPVGLGEVFVIA